MPSKGRESEPLLRSQIPQRDPRSDNEAFIPVKNRTSTTERFVLFVGIFIVGYAYGLEGQLRLAYTPYATSSFNLHSYLATINVLRSVVAVAAQPTAAKVADVFGRFEVILAATVIYAVGIATEATASSVEVFCTGAVIYQLGYTCIVLLMEVIIADFSSMRSRVFFSYIPAIPFVINTWISGNITSAVLSTTSWRWGIGMWAIIYPLASIPLLVTLYIIQRRDKLSTAPQKHQGNQIKGIAASAKALFHLSLIHI